MVMVNLTLLCEERKSLGTGQSRYLRKKGRIPAIIYGFDKNYKVSLLYTDFLKGKHHLNLLSRLVNIKLNDKILKVIPKDVQTDPVTDRPLHIDFQLTKDNVPIKVAVLIKLINRDKSPGIKKGGILNLVKKSIYMYCIPNKIPPFLQIDISGFEIGRNVHVHDIALPDGASLIRNDNSTVLTITGRSEEKDEEEKQNVGTSENDEKNKRPSI